MTGLDVLQVVSDTDRRGAEVFASDLGAELVRTGWNVHTVALAPGRSGGLDVTALGRRPLRPTTLRDLRRQIGRAGVVVAHGSTTLPACAIAGAGTGVPFVYRQISDSRYWASTAARRARVRLGMGRAARVVALWPGSAAALHQQFGVPAAKIAVIPNGVAPQRFTPPGPGRRARSRERLASLGLDPVRFTVLCVGALAPEKRTDLAVAAVGLVPGVQLVVVGDGPERAALAGTITSPGHVAFAGAVTDVEDWYVLADAVVLPSRSESMPATLIEAGLMALPCVATDVGAVPAIVEDGVTGRLVASGDVDAIARAITELRDDPALARRLGAAGEQRCRVRFTIAPVAAAWADLLSEVSRRRPPRS